MGRVPASPTAQVPGLLWPASFPPSHLPPFPSPWPTWEKEPTTHSVNHPKDRRERKPALASGQGFWKVRGWDRGNQECPAAFESAVEAGRSLFPPAPSPRSHLVGMVCPPSEGVGRLGLPVRAGLRALRGSHTLPGKLTGLSLSEEKNGGFSLKQDTMKAASTRAK